MTDHLPTQPPFIGVSRQYYVSTGVRQSKSDRPTDPLRAPRDYGYLVPQPEA